MARSPTETGTLGDCLSASADLQCSHDGPARGHQQPYPVDPHRSSHLVSTECRELQDSITCARKQVCDREPATPATGLDRIPQANLRRAAISLAESAIPPTLACARRCHCDAATEGGAMGPAYWQTPDDRIAGRAGDRTRHCPSAAGDRRPAPASRGHGDDHGSAIELRLYLPRRAWHFTFTRKRATPVELRGIVQIDDDRDQIAAPTVS